MSEANFNNHNKLFIIIINVLQNNKIHTLLRFKSKALASSALTFCIAIKASFLLFSSSISMKISL